MGIVFINGGVDQAVAERHAAEVHVRNTALSASQHVLPMTGGGIVVLPRRLYWTTDRRICEEGDLDATELIGGVGHVIPDPEAKRLGIVDYLLKTGDVRMVMREVPEVVDKKSPEKDESEVEAKAVEKDDPTVEDKAVDAADTENKGVSFPAESRRQPGRPRQPGV
jgi:hypothetical protein